MATTMKLAYDAPVSIIAGGTGLLNLASGSGWQAGKIQQSAVGKVYIDQIITLNIKLVAGSPAGDKQFLIYVSASPDGTIFDDSITGTDGAWTPNSPVNLALMGTITTPAGDAAYSKTFSLYQTLGFMPPYYALAVINSTGLAATGTLSDHTVEYIGVYTVNLNT